MKVGIFSISRLRRLHSQIGSGKWQDWHRLGICCLTLVGCFALLLSILFAASLARADDWPKYLRDLANSAHSTETGINSSNVSSLKTKWTFQTGGEVSDSPAVATINGTSTVFIGAWNGIFYALNAVTGEKLWSFQVDIIPPCHSGRCRIGSSPAVDAKNNLVFFGSRNAYLYALNATNGNLIWKQQLGNPTKGAEVWSSPAFYNGMVYVGLASHDDSPCVIGLINAYNELSGSLVWGFSTIDQTTCPEGVCVGGAVWSSVAIDDTNGIVYADTGNPGSTCTPPTQNATLYPDSVLALSADTGSLLNYYLAVKNDNLDDDFGSSPVLHMSGQTNQCTGHNTTAYWVTAMNKLGGIFVLNRDATGLTGKLQTIQRSYGFIASSALLAQTKISQCGTGKQLINYVNNLYSPDLSGALLTLFQSHTGRVTVQKDNTVGKHALLAAPAIIEDVVLFGGDKELIVAKTDGTTLVSFPIGSAIYSGVAISNNRIYFGAADGTVYCMSVNGR
jgi:outer membrane protein assembly factor BamB